MTSVQPQPVSESQSPDPLPAPESISNSFQAERANTARRPPPVTLGAIDVGTNSVHLVMVEISPEGDFTVLGRDKDMVQLGKGGFADHRLTDEAMDAAINALKRFKKMAELKGVDRIKAVATSAVREAQNGGDFVRRVEDEVGIRIQVIAPEEEARLIYLGVRHAVDLGNQPEHRNLIVDIGGGSVELVVCNAQHAVEIHSVKLGGSRLAELFLAGDPPRRSELKALRRHIERQMRPVLDAIGRHAIQRCIATSGTAKSLMLLEGRLPEHALASADANLRITYPELKSLTGKLLGLSRAQRMKIQGMDAKRVDACLPAATLLTMLMKELKLDVLAHCDMALREGVIVNYIGTRRQKLMARATWPNPRIRSVIQLAERCHYRQAHAEQVARLAMQLFDQLRPLHALDDHYKELLSYASLLHDVGYLISHEGHHKHSYYLIRNGALKGFSDQEIEVIANIARYHRKDRPRKSHYSFSHLEGRHRKPVRKLAILLRLANALDRTHYAVVRGLTCSITKGGPGVSPGDTRPRVRIAVDARRDAELELWTTRRHAKQFRREFKHDLEVVQASPQVPAGIPPA